MTKLTKEEMNIFTQATIGFSLDNKSDILQITGVDMEIVRPFVERMNSNEELVIEELTKIFTFYRNEKTDEWTIERTPIDNIKSFNKRIEILKSYRILNYDIYNYQEINEFHKSEAF